MAQYSGTTQRPVPINQCQLPNIHCHPELVPSGQCPVPSTHYPVLSAHYPVLSTQYQVPSIHYPELSAKIPLPY